MKTLSLFSGIGAASLAVDAHFSADTVAFCEQDPHCQKVLAKRFPGVPIFDDVRTLGRDNVPAGVTIIEAGSPCQDLSQAGQGKGLIAGNRSALFFEVVRIASEIDTVQHVFVENVPAMLSKWRGVVEQAFAAIGFGVTWAKVSAADVGAPHLRRRVFLLATRGAPHGGVCEPPVAQCSRRWTSPIARDYKDSSYSPNLSIDTLPRETTAPAGASANRKRKGGQVVKRSPFRLFPNWVEALQGLPIGWTDLECDQPTAAPWPAPMIKGQWGDSPQFDHEPPRTVSHKVPNRAARLRALGNCNPPAQYALALALIAQGPGQRGLFDVLD